MTKNAPELRFEGFTDDWELRKFNEVLDYSVSNNTLPRAELNYDNGIVKNIHYGDILTKFDYVVNIAEDDIPYITDGTLEEYNKNLLENGDVILADTAEDETTGKAIEIAGITDSFVVSGLHTLVARPNIKFASNYLGYYLNSSPYHNQLIKLMQGIKVLSISKGNVAKTDIKYPRKINEQNKIGSFFKQLDNTIVLHQRKLDLLKQLKQAYLQKMFPENGDKVPEIRFAGFDENWEQRKLGEESDVRDGTHDSPKYYNNGYPLVTSKNLKDSGLDLSDVSFISKEDFKSIIKRSKVDIGDILFGMIGTIGNPVQVDRDDFAIKNVALIKERKTLVNNFLIQVLKSPGFARYIRNENAGGTQKFLSLSKVRDFEFLCPNINEQKNISEFLKQLDDIITLHREKNEALKKIKKAFLSKMFI